MIVLENDYFKNSQQSIKIGQSGELQIKRFLLGANYVSVNIAVNSTEFF